MSNKKSNNGASKSSGKKQLNENVRGGYNPPTSEQKPKPPAKPPSKPKK